jgi:hypothetical protein
MKTPGSKPAVSATPQPKKPANMDDKVAALADRWKKR